MTDCRRDVAGGGGGGGGGRSVGKDCGGGSGAGEWTVRVVVVEEFVLLAGSIVKENSRMFAQNSVTAKQTMANQISFFLFRYYWQK